MMELHKKILNEAKEIWNNYKDKEILNLYLKEILKEEKTNEDE